MSEDGITNLGPIPPSMSVLDATRVMLRSGACKNRINPEKQSRRLTICETLREIWRESEKPQPDMGAVQDLLEAAFDYAKRMDARIKELKEIANG